MRELVTVDQPLATKLQQLICIFNAEGKKKQWQTKKKEDHKDVDVDGHDVNNDHDENDNDNDDDDGGGGGEVDNYSSKADEYEFDIEQYLGELRTLIPALQTKVLYNKNGAVITGINLQHSHCPSHQSPFPFPLGLKNSFLKTHTHTHTHTKCIIC